MGITTRILNRILKKEDGRGTSYLKLSFMDQRSKHPKSRTSKIPLFVVYPQDSRMT